MLFATTMVYKILNFCCLILNMYFAEQMILYCLINLLNKDKDASDIINCIQQHTFCKFKSDLKYRIIDKYFDKCEFF